MKTIIFTLLFILLALTACASPIITCDPPAQAENVVAYELKFGSAEWQRTPAPLAYDISAFPNGRHDVQVRAVGEVRWTGDGGSEVVREVVSEPVAWGFVKTGGEINIPGNVRAR